MDLVRIKKAISIFMMILKTPYELTSYMPEKLFVKRLEPIFLEINLMQNHHFDFSRQHGTSISLGKTNQDYF